MSEGKVGFIYTFSDETTKKILEGEVSLNSGGARRDNGTLLEMGKPLSFDSSIIDFDALDKRSSKMFQSLSVANHHLDLLSSDIKELQNIAWIHFAATQHIYQMSYEGFKRTIQGLGALSTKVDLIASHMDEKESGDRIQLMSELVRNLNSIAGLIDDGDFPARASYLNVTATIDKVASYLERLFHDLKKSTGNDEIGLRCIFCLIKPYAYVISRFSALYFYESGHYPKNYVDWITIIERISRDSTYHNRLKYLLRVYTDLSLQTIVSSSKRVCINLRCIFPELKCEEQYVLSHTKDQYMTRADQIMTKIMNKDYKLINGHLSVLLE